MCVCMCKGGGSRYQTLLLSDLCVWMRGEEEERERKKKGTGAMIRRPSESLAKCRSGEGEVVEEEEEEDKEIMCNRASCLFLFVF